MEVVRKETVHTVGHTEGRLVLVKGLSLPCFPLKEEAGPPKEVN